MNRKATGDGALFEWDNGYSHGTHIWIYQNKFFANVMFSTNCRQMVFFSSSIQDNKWYTLALSFNADTGMISMFLNGEQEDTFTTCIGDLKPATNVKISKRYVHKDMHTRWRIHLIRTQIDSESRSTVKGLATVRQNPLQHVTPSAALYAFSLEKRKSCEVLGWRLEVSLMYQVTRLFPTSVIMI